MTDTVNAWNDWLTFWRVKCLREPRWSVAVDLAAITDEAFE